MTSADYPFEIGALEMWLRSRGICCGPLHLTRIGGGHSNLTYAVRSDTGTFVLRRPPPTPLARGANDVLREARILQALEDTDVPVPRVLAVAPQSDVMDVPFYVMEHLEGVVATTALPPALDVPGGRASYPSSVAMTVVPARVAGVPSVSSTPSQLFIESAGPIEVSATSAIPPDTSNDSSIVYPRSSPTETASCR